MKILLDTNVILDIALNRQPHVEYSVMLFELTDSKLSFYITPSSITYLLHHKKAIKP